MRQTEQPKHALTVRIPIAGLALGIGRNQAYIAARTGELPTITIGGRKLVPVRQLEKLLGLAPGEFDSAPFEAELRARDAMGRPAA